MPPPEPASCAGLEERARPEPPAPAPSPQPEPLPGCCMLTSVSCEFSAALWRGRGGVGTELQPLRDPPGLGWC